MRNAIKSFIVVGILATFFLTSCSSSNGSAISNNQEAKNETAVENTDQNTKTEESKIPTINEQIVFDDKGITITAKEIDTDNYLGPEIKLLIENNSDTDIIATAKAMAVNDFMITDFFYEKVTAGNKSNATSYLLSNTLEQSGITNIGKIEIAFSIFNAESYKTIAESDLIEIKTSLYDSMNSEPQDAGKELVNENGIRIIGKYVDENSFWGAGILLYIENDTPNNVIVSCDNVSINGFMCNGYLYSNVYSNKKSIDSITIFKSDLEENDIDKIEKLELTFTVFDSDNYKTLLKTDKITIDNN